MRLNRRRCKLLKKKTRELRLHARQSALQMLSAKPWVKSTKRQNRFLSIVPVNSHALVSSKRSKLRPVISKSKQESSRIRRTARAAALVAQVAQARHHQVKLPVQIRWASLSKCMLWQLRPLLILLQLLLLMLLLLNEEQLRGEKSKISDLITE